MLRLIPQRIASFEDLDLPAVLRDLAERPKGLLLVTGPTRTNVNDFRAILIA